MGWRGVWGGKAVANELSIWGPLAGGLAWLAFWIGASVLFRRNSSKPIIPRAPADASFIETGCSGRSLANVITRIGGARNCLLVYVRDGELVVTPTFPFTLMFLPEIYGLEVRAPIKEIEAHIKDGLFGPTVQIDFHMGFRPSFELRLRDRNGLLLALKGASNARVATKPVLRHGARALFVAAFLTLWGGAGFTVGLIGLRTDLDFMMHGAVVQGRIVGSTSANHAIVRYAVGGNSYTLDSLLGSGTYKVGDTEAVRYMPGRPEVGREQASFPFFVFWVIAGAIALLVALTIGLWPWIAVRLSNGKSPLPSPP